MSAVSERLHARIARDFRDDGTVAEVVCLVGGASDVERIQAAAVLAAAGDVDELRRAVALAEVDERDVLVNGGLANADWRDVLERELGAGKPRRFAAVRYWYRRIGNAEDLLAAWLFAAIISLLMAAVFFLTSGPELSETRGYPREQAEVVTIHDESWFGCGKHEGPRTDVTWRSDDPPAGLPGTFRDRSSCNGELEVGERYEVVRVADGDDLEVYVDPVSSQTQVVQLTAFGAAAGFGVAWVAVGIKYAVRRFRRRNGSSASASSVGSLRGRDHR